MPAPDPGLQFVADAMGRRSSLAAGQAVLVAAARAVSDGLGAQVGGVSGWRHRYPEAFVALTRALAQSHEKVLPAARAGLSAAHAHMVLSRDGIDLPLAQAAPRPGAGLSTGTVRGQGDAAPAPWYLPVGGKRLTGDAVRREADRWLAAGLCEPGLVAALHRVVAHPEWFDLSDTTFALLGAGAEAGPFRWLARWRARIMAVDLPDPAVWRRLARTLAEGNATLHMPLRQGAGTTDDNWTTRAGADLLRDTPEIAAWLLSFDMPMELGVLAYLDGEAHVRATLAMDAAVDAVCRAQPRSGLMFMPTPTDALALPAATLQRALAAWSGRGAVRRGCDTVLRLCSAGRWMRPHAEPFVDTDAGVPMGLVDALVLQQGPNYALAKRLQQWRALLARAAGMRVSSNVVPPTRTRSVVRSASLRAGYAGASLFGVEVFTAEATQALAAALWVHDLRCSESPARPAVGLPHPLALLSMQAHHGGVWTLPYLPRSVLPLAALRGALPGGRG